MTSPTLWLAIAVGMTLGLTLSNKVKMIQMPQMVAFLHGIGGGAAAIVSFLVLTDTGAPSAFERGSACLAMAMGMTTIMIITTTIIIMTMMITTVIRISTCAPPISTYWRMQPPRCWRSWRWWGACCGGLIGSIR